ncbi:MAG: glycoside hydrolase family 25 protein [Oscillospiraceae bacterium]|nr:glycoside hydrolase family 25 protein [Oscillospiraceae bacterium]
MAKTAIYKLIDVSHNNGVIDFEKVKAAGIDGVIIRDGYGIKSSKQIDRQWENNYTKAKAAGLLVGAYHYSYATTVAGAKNEAAFMLEQLKGKSFELPIYYDIEEKKQAALSKSLCTQMVQAFCNTLENAGAWAGVYSYDSFFASNLDSSIPSRYATWVARVENVFPTSVDESLVAMWQYSWKGAVNGVSGDVDLNYCYKDYPKLIEKVGLNRF